MNRTEQELKTLRTITLSREARTRMREELLSYTQLHSIPSARQQVRSPFAAFRLRAYAGISAAVLLIAALGGTAYASERALPGDALYSVKVSVAEPLQTALVPSERGKAAWHAILAERRLDEAAQLAAEAKLSTTTQDELATNFTSQVTASQESADRLQEGGDTAGSLSARSDLEARLAAHVQILSVIDSHFADASSTDAKTTHEALSRMLALVKNHEKAVASTRIALEDVIDPSAATSDSGDEADTASAATTTLAIATDEPVLTPKHIEAPEAEVTPAAQVETAAAVRTTEVQDILERHAALLKAFLPLASTTATSTATTTATTTEAVDQQDGEIKHGTFDAGETGEASTSDWQEGDN